MANISNSVSNTLITGTSDADSIRNLSKGQYVTIESGAGNDIIINGGQYVTIDSGTGNDTIKNNAYYTLINTGSGNNLITNSGGESTINTGDGNNNIFNHQSINCGSGDDYITSLGENLTINSGEGNNHIESMFYALVNLGSGNNFVWLVQAVEGMPKSTVNASGGDDTIEMFTDTGSAFINGSDSVDKIHLVSSAISSEHEGDCATVNAGKGNDTIYSNAMVYGGQVGKNYGWGRYIYLYAEGDDDDTIYDYKSIDLISITSDSYYNTVVSGNDLIVNVGTGSMTLKDAKDVALNIQGGTYSDSAIINNANDNLFIRGTSNNDSITNTGSNVTINAGKGDDTVNVVSNNIIQYASGDGNDIINGFNSNDTLQITDDSKYTIGYFGSYVEELENNLEVNYYNLGLEFYIGDNILILNDVSRNDTFTLNIKDSAGLHKKIYNTKANSLVNGTTGDDYIENIAPATVNAGLGNDTILADVSTYIQYKNGDGNDIIYGSFWSANLDLAAGTQISEVKYDGKDTTLKIGNNYVTVKGWAAEFLKVRSAKTSGGYEYTRYVKGRAFDDLLSSLNPNGDGYYYYEGDSIAGTDKDEYIGVEGANLTILGNGGDDYIWDNFGSLYDSSIDGGAGKDTIFISQEGIIGGNTINGGGDNDEIKFDSFYFSGDLNTSINGGNGDDVIETSSRYESITGSYKVYNDDGDYYSWRTGNKGIEFGKGFTIKGGAGNDTIRNIAFSSNSNLYIGTEINDWINNDVLMGETVESNWSNENAYVQVTTWTDGKGNSGTSTSTSTKAYNRLIQYADGDGDDVVEDYNVGDTIQVTEGTLSAAASGVDVVIKVGDGSIRLKNAAGKAITVIDADRKSSTNTYTDSKVTIPTGLKYDSDRTVLTVEDKYKGTLTPTNYYSTVVTISGSTRKKAIDITGNDNSNSIAGGRGKDTLSGGKGADTLNGNEGHDILTGGNGNDLLDGGLGNDKLNGDAGDDILQGGKGNDAYTGGNGNDTFIYANGDGNDVISDYAAGEDVIKLTSGEVSKVSTSKKGDLAFTVGKGSIKVTSGKSKRIKFVDNSNNVLINQSFGNKSLTITNDDLATVNAAIDAVVVTIDSSARTDDVLILGNANKNTIQLGSGNSTVTTGKGKDTISYVGGNLVITDYAANQDSIKLNEAQIKSSSLNENDVLLTTDKGIITVKNVKGKKITTIDKDGYISSQVYSSDIITVTNTDGDRVEAYDGTITLDASKRTKPILLIGNSANNTLIGGKNGKKKFDTLTGGAGADVFVYNKGAGYDIITDYSANEGDVIQLGAKAYITETKVSGNDRIFTISGGKITVQGGASQNITFKDADDNEFSYKAVSSSAAFEERWFLDNSESGISNSELDSIIDSKSDIAVDYKFVNNNKFIQNDIITSFTQNQSDKK